MILFNKHVLVEQIMTKKESQIILDAGSDDREKFNFEFKVTNVAEDCDNIKIGDNPLFVEHVRFQGLKVIEKTDEKMIAEVIVHEDDIIAIENERK